ncbi:3'(2'),5'-bisphosphate nucleotidase CysQ [Haloferula chungangensis]|uniref:3'(2'),5'-bisphosphate nucleotidase CysQ n=1 Tax=Haloferula chungangensis TaxID=1048331 RepID=A0ABW2L8L2_9BACT
MEHTLNQLLDISKLAGAEILKFYDQDPGTVLKDDASPLTLADLAAHRTICDELMRLFPEIPICSEEGMENGELEMSGRYWLVDPLDGTKEFLKKTGSFTVNIALIENGLPICGVIYAPATGIGYLGGKDVEACRIEPDGTRTKIQSSAPAEPPRFVASRDHAGPEVKRLLAAFPTSQSLSIGSSLKFCLVAEGSADAYLRDVPTMEWDTGAAHAILHAAGGHLLTWPDLKPLTYGKADFRNPSLITLGTESFAQTIATAVGESPKV